MSEVTNRPSYSYALATGEAAAWRLSLVNRVYGPECERILATIEIPVGGRVVDFGCGTGASLPWFARKVGQQGEVVGLDASAEQLAVARQSCAAANLTNVLFEQASAYDSGLSKGQFDVAHCRLLLCHLQQPEVALREMASLVRPGGVVICCDLDLHGLHSIPHLGCYDTMRALYLERRRSDGLDNDLALHMPAMMKDAGLRDIEMAIIHPVYFRGEEKRLWEYTFVESRGRTLEKKLIKAEDLDRLLAEIAAVGVDDSIGIAQASMPVCWAHKAV